MFTLSKVDVLIIVGSLAITLVVGLLSGRSQDKSAKAYFLASGRMPWWIIGSAFVATSVSSEQMVGTVGQAYEKGMGIGNWEWFTLPMYGYFILFFIPIYLKNRITTISEFLTRRFGPRCGDIYSWIMLVAYVFVFLVPVLYGGTLTISDLTGWNFQLVLWGMVLFVILYTLKGGLASVMWTDALQCLLLVGGGVLLFFIALHRIPGGWGAMIQASPQRFHLYYPPSDKDAPFAGLVAGTFGLFIFYQAANQVMVQRVLSARTMWDGVMGIIFSGFIGFIRPLVTCFLGFIVYHWIHVMHQAEPLKNKDTAFPFALKYLTPDWGVRGIVLAGFLAAVLSTISALANSTATLFSLDVYKKLIKPDAGDIEQVRVGKIAALLSLVIASLVAPQIATVGIFKYFQTGVTYLSTPFISVILLGLLWRRTNYAGALFGLIGGLIIQIIVAVGAPAAGIEIHWLYLGFIAQVLTMLGTVIVSLATAPPPPAQSEPFHWSLALVGKSNDLARPHWYSSLRLWFGVYAAIWCYLYWRYW